MTPPFNQGVYEGPSAFDDVYTRIVDAMVAEDQPGYVADPRGTLRRCQRQGRAALAVLQQRAFEVLENIDFVQAFTDQQGDRETAWIWRRGDLEQDVLGLPGGPYVDEDDLDDDVVSSNDYQQWKQRHGQV